MYGAQCALCWGTWEWCRQPYGTGLNMVFVFRVSTQETAFPTVKKKNRGDQKRQKYMSLTEASIRAAKRLEI